MTQDEVDLIYNYLHENYQYVEGELISIKNRPGCKIGKKLGCFKYNKANEKPFLISQIMINNKKYYIRNAKLNYIFFHKKYEKHIRFIDNNISNIKIENLIACNKKDFNTKENYLNEKKGYWERNMADGTVAYMVQVQINNKMTFIGSYKDKETAKEVFYYCRHLLINEKLTLVETKKIARAKFPPFNRKINKTGFPGVTKINNRYSAFCASRYIGCFLTPEEAHAAYLKAKEEYNK